MTISEERIMEAVSNVLQQLREPPDGVSRRKWHKRVHAIRMAALDAYNEQAMIVAEKDWESEIDFYSWPEIKIGEKP